MTALLRYTNSSHHRLAAEDRRILLASRKSPQIHARNLDIFLRPGVVSKSRNKFVVGLESNSIPRLATYASRSTANSCSLLFAVGVGFVDDLFSRFTRPSLRDAVVIEIPTLRATSDTPLFVVSGAGLSIHSLFNRCDKMN